MSFLCFLSLFGAFRRFYLNILIVFCQIVAFQSKLLNFRPLKNPWRKLSSLTLKSSKCEDSLSTSSFCGDLTSEASWIITPNADFPWSKREIFVSNETDYFKKEINRNISSQSNWTLSWREFFGHKWKCKLVQTGRNWCKLKQTDANWCKLMQTKA